MAKFFEWSHPASRTYDKRLYDAVNKRLNTDADIIDIFKSYGFPYVVRIEQEVTKDIVHERLRWGCKYLKEEFSCVSGKNYFFRDKQDAVLFGLAWR